MMGAIERQRNFVVPTVLAVVVVPLWLLLMVVGARSPNTHMNLMTGYDPSYSRTEQGFVGPPTPLEGMMSAAYLPSDLLQRGRQLFVVKECASCHGLDGHGGVIGPSIVGVNAEKLRKVTQEGLGGMPAYASNALSDADLQAIAEYLKKR